MFKPIRKKEQDMFEPTFVTTARNSIFFDKEALSNAK